LYEKLVATNPNVAQKGATLPYSSLLRNTRELKKFFDLSYAYVGCLKPKPTTKTTKAKKR
jgi:hypothetical protein